MKKVTGVLIAFLLCVCTLQASQIREFILGDMDGFVYNGVGSVDDVYVDPLWLNWANNNPAQLPINNFDVFDSAQLIPFTFCYDLAPDEQVVSATLTLGLRNTSSESLGSLLLSIIGTHEQWRPSFADLGWNPISQTGTSIRSVDLSNFHGSNIIPNLQNGLLDAAIMGNIAIDYAQLTLEIIPEPATFLLLSCGLWFTKRLSK